MWPKDKSVCMYPYTLILWTFISLGLSGFLPCFKFLETTTKKGVIHMYLQFWNTIQIHINLKKILRHHNSICKMAN